MVMAISRHLPALLHGTDRRHSGGKPGKNLVQAGESRAVSAPSTCTRRPMVDSVLVPFGLAHWELPPGVDVSEDMIAEMRASPRFSDALAPCRRRGAFADGRQSGPSSHIRRCRTVRAGRARALSRRDRRPDASSPEGSEQRDRIFELGTRHRHPDASARHRLCRTGRRTAERTGTALCADQDHAGRLQGAAANRVQRGGDDRARSPAPGGPLRRPRGLSHHLRHDRRHVPGRGQPAARRTGDHPKSHRAAQRHASSLLPGPGGRQRWELSGDGRAQAQCRPARGPAAHDAGPIFSR